MILLRNSLNDLTVIWYFSKMGLFLWRHFEINSGLLFNKFLWLALPIRNFSNKHTSYLLDRRLYIEAEAATLHFKLKLIPFTSIRNEFLDHLNRDLKSIGSLKKVLVFSDKGTNLYEISCENYQKLLHDNIT